MDDSMHDTTKISTNIHNSIFTSWENIDGQLTLSIDLAAIPKQQGSSPPIVLSKRHPSTLSPAEKAVDRWE